MIIRSAILPDHNKEGLQTYASTKIGCDLPYNYTKGVPETKRERTTQFE